MAGYCCCVIKIARIRVSTMVECSPCVYREESELIPQRKEGRGRQGDGEEKGKREGEGKEKGMRETERQTDRQTVGKEDREDRVGSKALS